MFNSCYARVILICSILIFHFGILAGCAPAPLEPVTLKLNWQHNAEFLGFYVAQAKGYYAEEGLEVTMEPMLEKDEAIFDRLVAGEFDFSAGGAVRRAQSEGLPVTAVAAFYQYGPEAFFARADSGILTPVDFAGRRVVVKSPGWRKMLETILAHADLTLDDVETVSGGFDMTPFLEGEVEIWCGYLNIEIIRARQAGLELVTFPLYEYDIPLVALTLNVAHDTVENNPDFVIRFLRASLRGWEWAVEHPVEAVDIMLALYPEFADEQDFHLASFDASIPLIRPSGVQIGAIDCDYWLDYEPFEALDSTDGLCTTEFLEKVRESR